VAPFEELAIFLAFKLNSAAICMLPGTERKQSNEPARFALLCLPAEEVGTETEVGGDPTHLVARGRGRSAAEELRPAAAFGNGNATQRDDEHHLQPAARSLGTGNERILGWLGPPAPWN